MIIIIIIINNYIFSTNICPGRKIIAWNINLYRYMRKRKFQNSF